MRKITFADNESRAGETDEQAYARAMRDPEVQEIMRDPVFQSILQQAQQDPPSLQSHMKDPMIRRKVEKLVKAVSSPTLSLSLLRFTELGLIKFVLLRRVLSRLVVHKSFHLCLSTFSRSLLPQQLQYLFPCLSFDPTFSVSYRAQPSQPSVN